MKSFDQNTASNGHMINVCSFVDHHGLFFQLHLSSLPHLCRTRFLYLSFLRHFGLDVPDIKHEDRHKHHNFTSRELNLDAEFKWYPFMNESWLDAVEEFTRDPPTLVIASAATWTIKQTNGSADGLAKWKEGFEKWAVKVGVHWTGFCAYGT